MPDEKDNLFIWKQVETTDPDVTKHVNMRGGFTAICAQSQVKKATEIFGPIGIGWGIKEQFITNIGPTMIYQAILWYKINGQEGEYPIAADIEVEEDDCVKKVRTAAVTKGLSWLGFNSDVFEGKFDDNRYVASLKKAKSNPPGASDRSGADIGFEAKKNEKIAAARAKEAEAQIDRGKIHQTIFDLEQEAHGNGFERENSRMKHLGCIDLPDATIDDLRLYYTHLTAKIKEKKNADPE